MALFQTSVLKSYLAQLDDSAVEKAFKKYQKYFWNTSIQENIKKAKEEQYQATFLNELFVNILGYTLFPNPDSNLTTEFKNEKNARKADGAILKEGSAIGVIELKGTNTKDLESIRKQAFDYKANNKGCVYVITSNFEKLRFYINDATEFEEFDLFTLSREQFNLLYQCLQKDKILNNVPLKIKEASIAEEEEITKDFYKDYSLFKRELYRDLIKNNSKTVKDKLAKLENIEDQEDIIRLEKNVRKTLFKKSQKLIDRFLFIFFAEDRMLLPSNSTRQILDKWKDDWDFGDERPLYDLFKQYFNFLDEGRKGTEKRAEIYAYNGGLFKTDYILDALEIDNDLLYKYTLKLSNYDFESQVGVNILGHIFENSLNEIESINAEIEGEVFEKQTSKRKKDGVFYTPKYITKYIVENTVGKLCDEKKQELGFDEEQYFKGRKNRNKKTISKLVDILDTYRDWLLKITICDPACGSGAFLNQALDFLIKEHHYIDELKAQVLGGGLQFPDIENTILENNIYGVDLNEESVEIAKLSLWLRTAQPRRKLNDLSTNIKCGNSLIDNKNIAGDKAFKWQLEFPNIFENGGFDVIIGNPPYGANLSSLEKDYIKKRYKTMEGDFDTYIYFMELTYNLGKNHSEIGMIVPNNILLQKFGRRLRKMILDNSTINSIIDYGYKVFSDAVVPTVVMTYTIDLDRNTSDNIVNYIYRPEISELITEFEKCYQKDFYENEQFAFNIQLTEIDKKLLSKLSKESKTVQEVCELKIGIEGAQKYINDHPISDISKPMVRGRNFHKYTIDFESDPKFIEYDPKILHRAREERLFDCPKKLLIRQTGDRIIATLDTNRLYAWKSVFVIVPVDGGVDLEFLLGLLNSNVLNFQYQKMVGETGRAFAQVKGVNLNPLPIKIPSEVINKKIKDLVDNALEFGAKFSSFNKKFKSYLTRTQQITLSRNLENWYELKFVDFIKEIDKGIKSTNKLRKKENLQPLDPISKKDEFEWMDLFEENKKKAQELQVLITETEVKIDQMVYELYGLTEKEIQIVENS